tara:strand:+ start:848 stop:1147 length:300 start_codon:yes stop_codon:yes gene_type:complete
MNKNTKTNKTIKKEVIYDNGLNRLANGLKITLAETGEITQSKVGYINEKKYFRVVRCCDVENMPVKYYFSSINEYEKISGNNINRKIKEKWIKENILNT